MTDLRIRDYNPLSLGSGGSITIYLSSQPMEAFDGENLAACLLAHGLRVISRSLKYHRPRGLYCLNGRCGQCLMRVNGVPNVRICIVDAREGMILEWQNAAPSVNHDVLAILDKLGFLLPAGFQYKRLFRPQFLVPLYQKIIRRISGHGQPPDEDLATPVPKFREVDADVCVIGGGPAGLSAALSSAEAGATTVLLDDGKFLGGHLMAETGRPYRRAGQYEGLAGFEVARHLASQALSRPKVHQIRGMAIGVYGGKIVAASVHDGIQVIRSRSLVVCTGAYERRPIFNNNDLPGIFSHRALLRLVNLHRVRPGYRGVVYARSWTDSPEICRLFREAGIGLEAFVSPEQEVPTALDGVQVYAGCAIRGALGGSTISGVEIRSLDRSEVRRVRCDFLCLSGFLQPTYEIQFQAGCEMTLRPELGGYVAKHDDHMETTVSGLFVAGEAAGIRNEDSYIEQGRAAGLSAASSAGFAASTVSPSSEALRAPTASGPEPVEALPRAFVCLCEDNTLLEIFACIEEGFDDMESLKRYSGTGMGICQGKFCLLGMLNALRRAVPGAAPKFTTQRPPIAPIKLGSLAAEGDEGTG